VEPKQTGLFGGILTITGGIIQLVANSLVLIEAISLITYGYLMVISGILFASGLLGPISLREAGSGSAATGLSISHGFMGFSISFFGLLIIDFGAEEAETISELVGDILLFWLFLVFIGILGIIGTILLIGFGIVFFRSLEATLIGILFIIPILLAWIFLPLHMVICSALLFPLGIFALGAGYIVAVNKIY